LYLYIISDVQVTTPSHQVEQVLKEEKSKRLTTIPMPQKKNPINWQRFMPKYNELVDKARRRFTHSPAKSSTWTKFREGKFKNLNWNSLSQGLGSGFSGKQVTYSLNYQENQGISLPAKAKFFLPPPVFDPTTSSTRTWSLNHEFNAPAGCVGLRKTTPCPH